MSFVFTSKISFDKILGTFLGKSTMPYSTLRDVQPPFQAIPRAWLFFLEEFFACKRYKREAWARPCERRYFLQSV